MIKVYSSFCQGRGTSQVSIPSSRIQLDSISASRIPRFLSEQACVAQHGVDKPLAPLTHQELERNALGALVSIHDKALLCVNIVWCEHSRQSPLLCEHSLV